MLFQNAPAETTFYMLLGYAVIYGMMLIYIISLASRRRNLEKDFEILNSLDEEK